jgi:hypothetical protein
METIRPDLDDCIVPRRDREPTGPSTRDAGEISSERHACLLLVAGLSDTIRLTPHLLLSYQFLHATGHCRMRVRHAVGRFRLVCLSLLMAGLLAGCGGSGGSAIPTAPERQAGQRRKEMSDFMKNQSPTNKP